MMRAVIFGLFAVAMAGNAMASVEDDQEAIKKIVPGRIINTDWGWIVGGEGGDTHVIRTHCGYTVTTPRETFHLVRTQDGFAIREGKRGVRILSPDQWIDVREQLRKRR